MGMGKQIGEIVADAEDPAVKIPLDTLGIKRDNVVLVFQGDNTEDLELVGASGQSRGLPISAGEQYLSGPHEWKDDEASNYLYRVTGSGTATVTITVLEATAADSVYHGPLTDDVDIDEIKADILVEGKYNATLPTHSDGDRGDLQLDDRGRLITELSEALANGEISIDVAAQALATLDVSDNTTHNNLGSNSESPNFDPTGTDSGLRSLLGAVVELWMDVVSGRDDSDSVNVFDSNLGQSSSVSTQQTAGNNGSLLDYVSGVMQSIQDVWVSVGNEVFQVTEQEVLESMPTAIVGQGLGPDTYSSSSLESSANPTTGVSRLLSVKVEVPPAQGTDSLRYVQIWDGTPGSGTRLESTGRVLTSGETTIVTWSENFGEEIANGINVALSDDQFSYTASSETADFTIRYTE